MGKRTIPAAALVVVASAAIGGLFGSRVLATQDRATERLRIYTAALAAIENEYVEPVDSARLVYGSIDGMLHTLDPHSYFFDPREYAQMRERQEGHYYGLGITIVVADGDITVTNLFEGSPAYRAGIRRGDVIARIVGQDAKGWTSDQAVAKLKGPKGTTVNISIRRPGVEKLIDLTVERDEINITTVRTAFMLAPGTGYIRLQDFSDTTDQEVGDALKKLNETGLQRLVLDLRDNPGGPLDQAIAVANRFLKVGQLIVYTRGRLANSDVDYNALKNGDTTLPLIVLVNRNSASASEIVTGAMQDHDRGLVVGETTFGKALVQSVFSISEGTALALTSAHYFTPSGRMIQRPWDGSFDEYSTYTLRDQNGSRPHPDSELKYTDGGRKVYGGGGIEPDHFIPGSIEGFNPTRFSRQLVARGVFVGFAERFGREGDTSQAGKSAAAPHKVARGWPVTDAIVNELKEYIASQHIPIDDSAFHGDLAFITAEMRYEVDNDLFGNEEARRNISKVDPQALAALSLFDDAKRLLQTPKKGR